jgi:hypothetical protein
MKKHYFGIIVFLIIQIQICFSETKYIEINSNLRAGIEQNNQWILDYCKGKGKEYQKISLDAVNFYYNSEYEFFKKLGNSKQAILFGNSIGYAFADCIAQETGLEWIIVEDLYGKDAVLFIRNTEYIVNAIGMINKRIVNGEKDLVIQLGNVLIEEIKRTKDLQNK